MPDVRYRSNVSNSEFNDHNFSQFPYEWSRWRWDGVGVGCGGVELGLGGDGEKREAPLILRQKFIFRWTPYDLYFSHARTGRNNQNE